jgi:hypothetical protein
MNPFEWVLQRASFRRDLPSYPTPKPCPICQGAGTFVRDGAITLCPCETSRSDVVYRARPDGVCYPCKTRSAP